MSLILAGSISLDSTFRILLQAAKISWFFPHPLSDQLEDIPWDAEPMTESGPALQTGRHQPSQKKLSTITYWAKLHPCELLGTLLS